MKKFLIGFGVLLCLGMVIYGFMIGNTGQGKSKPLPSMLRLQESVKNYYRSTGAAPSGIDALLNRRYVSESELKDKNGKSLEYSYDKETGKCKIVFIGEDRQSGTSDDIVLEFDPAYEEPTKP